MEKNKKQHFDFPDPLEKDSVKETTAYGLQVAKAISQEWFNGGIIQKDCLYYKRSQWIEEMRNYTRGQQDEKFYKDLVSRQDEDLNYLNLDWRPDNEAGKYVNLVANGINSNHYRFTVTAIDRLSTEQKSKYYKKLEKEMYARTLVENAKKELEINIVPETPFVPKNVDEIDLHINTTYKAKQETAEELLVQYVFDANEWHNIEEQCNKDFVECGIAVGECFTDPTNGIELRYADPEYAGHSPTSKNDFSDRTYGFVLRKATIMELQRTGSFTETQLKDLVKLYGKKNGVTFNRMTRHTTLKVEDYLHFEVDVIDFDFKTSKKSVYKRRDFENGNFKLTGKTSDFEYKNTPHFSKQEKTLDTWYEGSFIVGSEIVYGWKECENVITDTLNRALGRFIFRATNIYKNNLHSFLQDIRPKIDQIMITKLKLQHIISEIRPGGAEIDLDMVANLTEGEQVDYKEIIAIFNSKGIVFKKRIADELGMVKEGRAVQEIENGIPSNIIYLLQILQAQKNELRDITGITPSAEGSQHHGMLVGVQQAQIVSSNTITAHISDAAKWFKLKFAEVISARISDIFRYKEEAAHLRKIYEKALGKMNMELLEEIGTHHLHEFGFDLEMLPTTEELSYFEESMKIALQAGRIDEDDILEARAIAKKNPKYATQYLKVRKKQRATEEMKRREIEAKIKSDNDIRSNTVASQNSVQELQMSAIIDIEKEKAMAAIDVEKQAMLNNINEPIRKEQYQLEAFKKQMDLAGAMKLNEFKETKKDERQNKNNTDHSKMIDQRKNALPPIDFTKKETFADLFK